MDFLPDLQRVARQAATALCPHPHQIDRLGHTRDDYESLLFWHAYQLGLTRDLPVRVLHRAIWHLALDWRRKQRIRRQGHGLTRVGLQSVPSQAPSLEAGVMAAQTLQRLATRLRPGDWDVLQQVAWHGSAAAAYGRRRRAGRRCYEIHVERVRARARRIVGVWLGC